MKKITEIKREARKPLKFHYWHAILICFFISIVIAGGLKYSSINIGENNINNTFSNINTLELFINKLNITNILSNIQSYKPTRGVLSIFFNQISLTGSLSFGVLKSINQILFNNSLSSIIISLLGIILVILNLIFIQNILIVGKNRYFLERRKHKETKVDKILFVYRIRKILNVAKIMFQKTLYQVLWSFTIIGGFIKYYEYSIIPYILAENPEINSKDCFKLSKELTRNNKFKLFTLGFSFIGWYFLGIITMGLSNIFIFNPYKESIYAEVYMTLRKDLLIKDSKYLIYLKDNYLDETADVYPNDQYFIKEAKRRKWLNINYNCNYQFLDLILIFFAISIIGWIWEVLLHLFNSGTFVNRGTLLGPWLPIYGTGGVLILILLKKYRDKPHYLFFLSMIISGIVEYFTSWYLEFFKGLRWWDYTGYFVNLNGRICLEGLLFFALGGYLITYFLAPFLENIFIKIPKKKKIIIVTILVTLFTIDFTYSHFNPNTGDGITTPKIETSLKSSY